MASAGPPGVAGLPRDPGGVPGKLGRTRPAAPAAATRNTVIRYGGGQPRAVVNQQNPSRRLAS